jgi:hypothetical protein
MNKAIRLTGGFNGYKEAVNEGFSVNIHNPALRYSDRRGFHIESKLTPRDDSAVELGECYYNLSNNGERNFGTSYRDYLEVKSDIIKNVYGLEQAVEFNCQHNILPYY